jgi:hypothetical protein
MSASSAGTSCPESGLSRPTGSPVLGNPANARRQAHLTFAIWALAVFTAFLFGATIVNIVVTRQAYDAATNQLETLNALNESMKEVQRSVAELTLTIREAQEQPREEEEEEPYQRPYLGNGRI